MSLESGLATELCDTTIAPSQCVQSQPDSRGNSSSPYVTNPEYLPSIRIPADEDYRGNVGVILFNHSDVDFHVKAGDRVAQLVLEKIEIADIEEVAELSDTARGAGKYRGVPS